MCFSARKVSHMTSLSFFQFPSCLPCLAVRVCPMTRATGPYRGGHGPDQPRHAGRREEPGGPREMLWPVRAALEEVRFLIIVGARKL